MRAGQYWRLENLGSFDDFLTKRFPESRRKAYYLMAIHEQLPRRIHHDLQQVGWSKAAELAKVARRDGERFDCATWLHKAIELPKEGFKREVEKHLTGQETEPWEIIYFKLYKSQLPVIERALETAALMLGASKSRGYCLEMICADFLAGAHLEGGNSDSLLFALGRLYSLLPDPQKTEFVKQMEKVQWLIFDHGDRGFGWTQILIANSAPKCWSVTAGDASIAGVPIVSRSTTYAREAGWVTTQTKI